MGFSYINDEQKIRIPLSRRAYIVMNDDMRVFSVSKPATFINIVIKNFHDQSKASLTSYLARKQQELEEIYSDCDLEDSVKDKVIDHAIEKKRQKTVAELQEYLKEKYVSRLYHINDDNFDFLRYDCMDEEFYKEKPGAYIKCLMEEYASLPFIKRERIFRREVYEIVENACQQHKTLQVRVDTPDQARQTFLVHPYKIDSDQLGTQEYLACYTRKAGEPISAKKDASFSMARFPKPTVMKPNAFLSKADINKIENDIDQRSIAYLLGEPLEVHVKLTDKGKKLYQTRLYSRPCKDDKKSTEDEYVFLCSEMQAYYYFFPFGEEAEILAPTSLRDKVNQNYIAATRKYI